MANNHPGNGWNLPWNIWKIENHVCMFANPTEYDEDAEKIVFENGEDKKREVTDSEATCDGSDWLKSFIEIEEYLGGVTSDNEYDGAVGSVKELENECDGMGHAKNNRVYVSKLENVSLSWGCGGHNKKKAQLNVLKSGNVQSFEELQDVSNMFWLRQFFGVLEKVSIFNIASM